MALLCQQSCAPSVSHSHGGHVDINEQISNLRKYIADHMNVIENFRILVDRCKTSCSRLKRANRSGGYLTRFLRERNGAVVEELITRYEQSVGKVLKHLDGDMKCEAHGVRWLICILFFCLRLLSKFPQCFFQNFCSLTVF